MIGLDSNERFQTITALPRVGYPNSNPEMLRYRVFYDEAQNSIYVFDGNHHCAAQVSSGSIMSPPLFPIPSVRSNPASDLARGADSDWEEFRIACESRESGGISPSHPAGVALSEEFTCGDLADLNSFEFAFEVEGRAFTVFVGFGEFYAWSMSDQGQYR